jgi:quercetin dioxygenase-like cupin family protein
MAAVTGVPEAQLRETEAGLVPDGAGWFVVNARDAPWWRHDALGQSIEFEGEPEFPEVAFFVRMLLPGQHGMYHGESGQEDFLVLSGECILIVEGEERRLEAWDFVHCPPMTEHIFVGAGHGPCVTVAIGRRLETEEIFYPVDEVAAKYDASVLEETSSPTEAYARFPRGEITRYREEWLP